MRQSAIWESMMAINTPSLTALAEACYNVDMPEEFIQALVQAGELMAERSHHHLALYLEGMDCLVTTIEAGGYD